VRHPPYVVLPRGADLDAAAREIGRHGWRVHRGFAPPDGPWDLARAGLVAAGVVDGPATAQAALLCAVRGAGLIAVVDRTQPWAAGFLADMARLAVPAPARSPEPAADRPAGRGPAADRATAAAPGPLTAEQRDLLDLLADGHSIARAARMRYLSLRTANRRVAEARVVLGVATTRDAVLAYVRLRGR
jgi:DNA-binding CsgD family transcriptional regulator